jgi:cell wall-associated NlpC family hydrolase
VEGYASVDYLIMGEEAMEIAMKSAVLYATVNSKVSALNVRTEPSTDSEVITKVKAGERLVVTKEVVVNKEDPTSQVWVEVRMDDDENADAVAYVSADYVTVSYELNWASKYTPYGPDVSELRVNICDYAKKWIGTKYVWGGNSLTKGIDCSGFVQQVYKHFGYTTPRVSRDMAKKYTKISIDELKPGDLIFYGRVKDNYINHVGIYIGNGQVIHSSTNYNGVDISSMYFYSILKCARIIKD